VLSDVACRIFSVRSTTNTEVSLLTDSHISDLLPVGFDGEGGEGASASEGDQDGAGASDSGASGDGGAGGTTDADGEAFASRDRALQEMRSAQSARDRLNAEIAQLEARRAEANRQDDGAADQPLTRAELLETLAERDRIASHRETMAGAVPGLREKFGFADAELFDRANEFDSVEALSAAAEASHTRVADLVASARSEEREAVLADVAAKYGINVAPANPPQNTDAEMTLDKFRALSFAEQGKFEREHPEVVDALLRSA
jgi:hypothetical protein